MSYDCNEVETSRPSEKEKCEYVSLQLKKLKCSNLATTKDRVKCRLALSENELDEELKISYLPEECRAMKNDADKENCVFLYGNVQKCWSYQGEQRIGCVKGILNLKSAKDEVMACKQLNESGTGKCMQEAKAKVFNLVKFRLYELEERAEEYLEEGKINQEEAAEFIAKVEEKKKEFNDESAIEGKKQIVLEVRELWKEFRKKVKE